jgi:hypothetical protein
MLPTKNMSSFIPIMLMSKIPLKIKTGKILETTFERYCSVCLFS